MCRFHHNVGVRSRHLVLPLPLEEYGHIEGFTCANDPYIEHAAELGARVLVDPPKASDLTPGDVDVIYCATVTGWPSRPSRRGSPRLSA